MRDAVLTKYMEAFRERNGLPPEKIVVAPAALLALGIKKSVGAVWLGVPVECRLFDASEAVKCGGKKLGLFLKEEPELRIAACELD